MPNFETRLKDVSHAAWLIWTANGLGLDDFELEQTSKSAKDTAINAYGLGRRHTHALAQRRIDEDHYGAWKSTRPSNVELTDKLYRRGCKNRA